MLVGELQIAPARLPVVAEQGLQSGVLFGGDLPFQLGVDE